MSDYDSKTSKGNGWALQQRFLKNKKVFQGFIVWFRKSFILLQSQIINYNKGRYLVMEESNMEDYQNQQMEYIRINREIEQQIEQQRIIREMDSYKKSNRRGWITLVVFIILAACLIFVFKAGA